jgi:hypothetical protein
MIFSYSDESRSASIAIPDGTGQLDLLPQPVGNQIGQLLATSISMWPAPGKSFIVLGSPARSYSISEH